MVLGEETFIGGATGEHCRADEKGTEWKTSHEIPPRWGGDFFGNRAASRKWPRSRALRTGLTAGVPLSESANR